MTSGASARIGFMQGRLSPQVDGRIQAFPAAHWRDEYSAAERLGLRLMEWTLDEDGLDDNPLMTAAGCAEIAALATRHGVGVETITGDVFMQAPFWKAAGAERERRLAQFDAVVAAAATSGARLIVVPLVDNGSADEESAAVLLDALLSRSARLRAQRVTIAFESDYPPDALAAFIARFPADVFGINYDTGNSAALGYDCAAEIAAYGGRIFNVHVKDRVRNGTTVPLGTGAADLPRAIGLLRRAGYQGRYILQTARAGDGDHAGALARYAGMVRAWLAEPVA